jgi:hypothetical protein
VGANSLRTRGLATCTVFLPAQFDRSLLGIGQDIVTPCCRVVCKTPFEACFLTL